MAQDLQTTGGSRSLLVRPGGLVIWVAVMLAGAGIAATSETVQQVISAILKNSSAYMTGSDSAVTYTTGNAQILHADMGLFQAGSWDLARALTGLTMTLVGGAGTLTVVAHSLFQPSDRRLQLEDNSRIDTLELDPSDNIHKPRSSFSRTSRSIWPAPVFK